MSCDDATSDTNVLVHSGTPLSAGATLFFGATPPFNFRFLSDHLACRAVGYCVHNVYVDEVLSLLFKRGTSNVCGAEQHSMRHVISVYIRVLVPTSLLCW